MQRVRAFLPAIAVVYYYVNFNLVIGSGINQMFNVIMIRSVTVFTSISFVLPITFIWLVGHHTNNKFGAGLNGIVLR